jgi:hypothetical protein
VSWLEAFVWTCAIETPVYVAVLRGRLGPWWAPIALSIVLQSLTHPPMWALFPRTGGYWGPFVAFELGVVLAEGALAAVALRRAGAGRPWTFGPLAALLANAASAAFGRLSGL